VGIITGKGKAKRQEQGRSMRGNIKDNVMPKKSD